MGHRLRELAAAFRGILDMGSRNLGPAFYTVPVKYPGVLQR